MRNNALKAIISSMREAIKILKHWGAKGGLGVLDQAVFSGSNFFLGVLLARWTSPDTYGTFSASFSIFLLFSTFQVALIAEPMSIFGASRYSEEVISYLNYLLRIQWIGAFIVALVIIGFTLFLPSSPLQKSIIAMAFSTPFILFYWYLRRAFYIEMQSGMAMITSLVYSTSLVIIIFLSQLIGGPTVLTVYIALAFSSLLASFFALKRLGVRFFGTGISEAVKSQIIMKELWDFGKWILPAYLAGWLNTMSFPFFLSILINSQSAAAYKAMQNLFLPLQQLLAAITLLVLPWLAREYSEFGRNKLFFVAQYAAAVSGLLAVIYCIVVFLFRSDIISLLYANDFYSSFDFLVVFLSISTLISTAPLILGLALRILDKPSALWWSKGCAALFTLLIGLPTIYIYHMDGVVFTMLGAVVVDSFILLLFYRKSKDRRELAYG